MILSNGTHLIVAIKVGLLHKGNGRLDNLKDTLTGEMGRNHASVRWRNEPEATDAVVERHVDGTANGRAKVALAGVGVV
jgi:hypothetical protein